MTDRLDLDYADEKLTMAVENLDASPYSLQAALTEAYTESLMHVRRTSGEHGGHRVSDDVELLRQVEEMHLLFTGHPDSGDGIVASTLGHFDDDQAIALAASVRDLHRRVRDALTDR